MDCGGNVLFFLVWPFNMGWPVTGNIEMIGLLGYIASIYYFILHLETGKRSQRWAYLGFLFCGIASKEFAYGAVLVFAFCWFLYASERSIRNLARTLSPSIVVCLTWAGYTGTAISRRVAKRRIPLQRLSYLSDHVAGVGLHDACSAESVRFERRRLTRIGVLGRFLATSASTCRTGNSYPDSDGDRARITNRPCADRGRILCYGAWRGRGNVSRRSAWRRL